MLSTMYKHCYVGLLLLIISIIVNVIQCTIHDTIQHQYSSDNHHQQQRYNNASHTDTAVSPLVSIALFLLISFTALTIYVYHVDKQYQNNVMNNQKRYSKRKLEKMRRKDYKYI